MTRFNNEGEEGIPWGLWETIVSNALGGRKGQTALAELERALLALPEPKPIEGHLAADGAVCAIGAFVAARQATERGVDLATVIDAMSVAVACHCGHVRAKHIDGQCHGKGFEDRPCYCDGTYEPDESEDCWETVEAGQRAGLSNAVAWHIAYLNDENYGGYTPEQRYTKMLAWVRRAQGEDEGASVGADTNP